MNPVQKQFPVKGAGSRRQVPVSFKSNRKVERTAIMGSVSECSYELDGQNAKLLGGCGAQLLKKNVDGTLDGENSVGKFYRVGEDASRMHRQHTRATGEGFIFKPDAPCNSNEP